MKNILNTFYHIFSYPKFPDNENLTRKARVLSGMLGYMLIFLFFSTAGTIFLFVNKSGAVILIGCLAVIVFVSYLLNMRRHVNAACRFFVTSMWIIMFVDIVLNGKIEVTHTSTLLGVTVMAGLLLGKRQVLVFTGLSLALGAAFIVVQGTQYAIKGIFPSSSWVNWYIWLLAFILTLGPLNLFLQDIMEALDRARESETRLKTISDNIPGGMTYQINTGVAGEVRKFTYVSAGVEKLHETDTDSVLADSRTLYSQIDELQIDYLTKLEQKGMKEMSSFTTEAKFHLPSGRTAWHLMVSAPRRNFSTGHIIWDGLELDITRRKETEDDLRRAIDEKNVLLGELYHRTKNTLQLISSMMIIQASSMEQHPVIESLVTNMENRINTIALVHQKLYQSRDLSVIHADDYISELAQLILTSYSISSQISLRLDVEAIPLNIDTAIPCGLILNELITNAVKHAFPEDRTGEIIIRFFRNKADLLEMQISDNGIGVPADFELRQQPGFGLQTILTLAEDQLQGRIDFSSHEGVAFTIIFPDQNISKRV